ncbi:MAG: hypothetical protein JNJ49_11005 [Bdellovibrionaceae bacterium]|nr:hypothetical protein [Pseudobdellovibrionaceae bacterium]
MRREDIQRMLDDGVGLILATADGNCTPTLADAEAIEVSADSKSILVYGSSRKLGSVLRDVKSNPRIAVTIGRPSDNAAIQFKGLVQSVRGTTVLEKEKARDLSDRYRKEISLLGVLPKVVTALDLSVDTVIEVLIVDVFNQTPGERAGQSLGWETD